MSGGNIFQIQRWSIHDGDGIRSVVFFKGCPLRCRWCANPESWNSRPQVVFFSEQCSGCGRCARVCDAGAIAVNAGSPAVFTREKCRDCGQCCAVCPTGARKKIGSRVTVEEVMKIINRDAIFYRESGGGVTFSGGEPFAQAHFLRELAMACKRVGIDTAVETCGYFNWRQVKDIFAFLDCVFMDIKHMDDCIHQELTGVSNRAILTNIAAVSRIHPNVIVRVPLIKEINAGEQNIENMCRYLRENTLVKGIEILPYHDFGRKKFNAVGIVIDHTFTTPDDVTVENVKQLISTFGIPILEFK
ncbi:pyruvate formate lyase activating enzyme [Desulfotomaculum arcticum]|uniref:Pyruvate formate lyase activating enzyme n=1 Tax=Desulfotruncus arcticus DSM 17038 TaxID=1121424 RepID=A0A1I2VVT5_9FIRM|nr:glycyl-radical enzyme activating protein [Desulfotruncus arcticus]SFG93335.1 pyruvate formate lyase activating enzyme [Desulfotomaculum arcticum] [Desulfotruncus arcticus DSM 17038]